MLAVGYSRRNSLAHCSIRWLGTANRDFWHSPRRFLYERREQLLQDQILEIEQGIEELEDSGAAGGLSISSPEKRP